MKPIISPARNLLIISVVVFFGAFALALAPLVYGWNLEQAWENLAAELLRAGILIVNVQILALSKGRYRLVIFLSLIATCVLGFQIYSQGLPLPRMLILQVLNGLIFTGELSLSFLLAGRSINYYNEYTELRQGLDDLRQHLETLRPGLETLRPGLDGLRQGLDALRTALETLSIDLGSLRQENETLRLASDIALKQSDDNRSALAIIRKALDVNRKALGGSKINIDGVKARLCKCGAIVRAASNKIEETTCHNCKAEIKWNT